MTPRPALARATRGRIVWGPKGQVPGAANDSAQKPEMPAKHDGTLPFLSACKGKLLLLPFDTLFPLLYLKAKALQNTKQFSRL